MSNDIVLKVKNLLAPILREPGSILYSAASTIQEGQYYFLGVNPGGSDGQPIEESLNDLLDKTSNSYIDEAWGNGRQYATGMHPLQQNARYLFGALGTRVEDVCSSNLIFSQSRDEAGAGYPEKAEICWPVHELILSKVKPRTIITFGAKPFEFIAQKLGAESSPVRPSGHGGWVCREARTSSIRLIGLPHLSRYHLQDKHDVIAWIAATK